MDPGLEPFIVGTPSQKPGDLFDGSIASMGLRLPGRTLPTALLYWPAVVQSLNP